MSELTRFQTVSGGAAWSAREMCRAYGYTWPQIVSGVNHLQTVFGDDVRHHVEFVTYASTETIVQDGEVQPEKDALLSSTGALTVALSGRVPYEFYAVKFLSSQVAAEG